MMGARDMASLMLGVNRETLVDVLETNGKDLVVDVLRAMADLIERGAFLKETMH